MIIYFASDASPSILELTPSPEGIMDPYRPRTVSSAHRNTTGIWGRGTGWRRRRFVALASVVLALGLTAACGSSDGGSSNAKAPKTVTIGLNGGYIGAYSGYMVAMGDNYLGKVAKDFGTTIKTQPFPGGGPTVMSAVLGGQLQGFMASASAGAVPASQGQPLEFLFNGFTGPGVLIVGAKKHEANGSDLAKYRGGTWCYTAVGAGTYLALQSGATQAGLDFSKEKGVAIGSVSAYLPTMKSGKCDITPMDAGSAATAVKDGIGYIVANLHDPDAQKQIFGGDSPQIGPGLIVTEKFANEYPDLAQAIVESLFKAQVFIQQNIDDPSKIYAALPQEFTSTVDEATYATQWDLVKPAFASTSGFVTSDMIKNSAAVLERGGLIEKAVPDSFWNMKFVEQASKDLGYQLPPDGSPVSPK